VTTDDTHMGKPPAGRPRRPEGRVSWFPKSMPVPAASRDTLGWWQAAAEHRLVVQRCDGCGRYRHPPSPTCPSCHSWSSSWVDHPGTGTIYTFTVVHQAFLGDLADLVPYVVAVVDLSGPVGTRLVTNIVDADPADVAIGAAVELVFEDMGPDLALPRARLIDARGSDA
jgi:uncharacterized protein